MDLTVFLPAVGEVGGVLTLGIFSIFAIPPVVALTDSMTGVEASVSPVERADDGYFVGH